VQALIPVLIATVALATILNVLLKRVGIPTVIGYIVTGSVIGTVFDVRVHGNDSLEGVAEFALRDLPARGLLDPLLPLGSPPRVLADAIRFAFLGGTDDAERVVSPGKGYAHVEVGLRFAGAEVSLFRGVDRRGSHQASLREDDGRRVTGGVAEVRARLEELVGAPLDLWERSTWFDEESDADPFRGAGLRRTRRPLSRARRHREHRAADAAALRLVALPRPAQDGLGFEQPPAD